MPVARRLMLPDFPLGTAGQTLIVQTDGTINWGTPTGGLPVFNVSTYGAVADSGVTDNTAAFNNALAALKAAGGGELWIPIVAGNYYGFTGQVACDQLQSAVIKGIGWGRNVDQQPELITSATGASAFWSLSTATNVTVQGLNFQHSNSGFTGSLLDMESNGAHDCFANKITGCGFGPAGSMTTATGITISAWLHGCIEECDFSYLNRAVVWGNQSAAHGVYVNGSVMRLCAFANSASNPIYLFGQDTEACSFEDLTFEPLASGVAGAFEGNGTIIYENYFKNIFVVEGAANGGTVFKKMYNANRPCVIIGGEIGSESGNGFGATGSTAMDLLGSWIIMGTQFNGGAGASVFSDPGSNQFKLHLIGGGTNGAPGIFAGAKPSPLYSLGFNGLADTLPNIPPPLQTITGTGNFSLQYGNAIIYTTGGATQAIIHQQSDGAAYVNPVGTSFPLIAGGSGAIQVQAGTGVTLHTPSAGAFIDVGMTATLTQVAVNTWVLAGQTAAS